MRRKFQEGGLGQAFEEEDQTDEPIDPTTGLMSILAQQYTTTPEAQQQARSILSQAMDPSTYQAETELQEKIAETAESSRAALQEARERVLGRQRDPALKWLQISAALGQPTRTGAFGETIGNVSEALLSEATAQSKLEAEREQDLLTVDQAILGVDNNVLQSELKLAQMRRSSMDRMAASALSQLGKIATTAPPGSKVSDAALTALNRSYAPKFLDWTERGAADAAKSLSELRTAMDALERSDAISGPIIGMAPKILRDMLLPESASVQEAIETTAQRSLKAILGGQFGQREGEMLLERTFNPRLPEEENRRRAFRLFQMIEAAKNNEDQKAAYYQQNQTLAGFKGNLSYTLDDFMLPPAMHSVEMPDGTVFEAPMDATRDEVIELYELSKAAAQEGGGETQEQLEEEAPQGFAKGGTVKKAANAVRSWRIWDPKDKRWASAPYSNQNRARHRMDKLDNEYGGYRYQVKEVEGHAKGGAIRKAVALGERKMGNIKRSFRSGDLSSSDMREVLTKEYGLDNSQIEALMEKLATKPISGYGRRVDELSAQKKKGGRMRKRRRYQAGGVVRLEDLPERDSETVGLDELRTSLEQDLISTAASTAEGAAAGAVTGLAAEAIGEHRTRGPQGRAEDRVRQAIERGGVDPQEAIASAKRGLRSGVPSDLITEGGSVLRGLTEAAIIHGEEESIETLQNLEARHEGARDRVAAQVNKGLAPYPYFEHMERLTEDLYTQAKPLYEKAYTTFEGIPEAKIPALSQLMDTPDGKRAVRVALRLLQNEGRTIGREDAIGLVRRPSLRFLDYVKRGFDQIISKEESMGATAIGRSMRELRNQLRTQLDEATTVNGKSLYGEARAQYGGDLEVLDALKTGREDFTRMQPEEIASFVGEMSFAEKNAYRTGVSQKLLEMISQASGDPNSAQRIVRSPMMMNRLRPLFDKPRDFRLFTTALEREAKMFGEIRSLRRRGESGRVSRISREAGPIDQLMGTVLGSKISPTGWVLRLLQSKPSMSEEQAGEILKVLDNGTIDELNALDERFQTGAARQARRRVLRGPRRGKAAAVGAGIGAGIAAGADYLLGDDEE